MNAFVYGTMGIKDMIARCAVGRTPWVLAATGCAVGTGLSLMAGSVASVLAGLALLPATELNVVFRFTTAVAFLGYCSTSLHCWLSERTPWRSVWKPAVQELLCSVVAGGIFGAMWPPT